jgi:hypothetical protein
MEKVPTAHFAELSSDNPTPEQEPGDFNGPITEDSGERRPEMRWIPHSTLVLGPSSESEEASRLLQATGVVFLSESSSDFYGPRLRLPDGRTLRGLEEIRRHIEQLTQGASH